MKNFKNIIRSVFFIIIMLGLEIKMPTTAMTLPPKKSEVQLNKRFVPDNSSIDKNTVQQYKDDMKAAWEIAYKDQSILNLKRAEYFCQKAYQAHLKINDIEESNKIAANMSKVHACIIWNFAKLYPTAENWLNAAHSFLKSESACSLVNDTQGTEMAIKFYKISLAFADIKNAQNAWKLALENPSYNTWINAEAFYSQAAESFSKINSNEFNDNIKYCHKQANIAQYHARQFFN